jgi:hypothetical protein
MHENCLNCKHAESIEFCETIKICTCPRSGCYSTDVTEFEWCNQWEQSEDNQ